MAKKWVLLMSVITVSFFYVGTTYAGNDFGKEAAEEFNYVDGLSKKDKGTTVEICKRDSMREAAEEFNYVDGLGKREIKSVGVSRLTRTACQLLKRIPR